MGKNRKRREREALTVLETYMDQQYPNWREDRYARRRIKQAAKKAAKSAKGKE